jgi:hypothetical protein
MNLNLVQTKLLMLELESILGKNINWINNNDYKIRKSIKQKYYTMPYYDMHLFNPQPVLIQQPIIEQPIIHQPYINSLDEFNVSIPKEILSKLILYINNLKNNQNSNITCPTCPTSTSGSTCPTCPTSTSGSTCPTCPTCPNIDLSELDKINKLIKDLISDYNKLIGKRERHF